MQQPELPQATEAPKCKYCRQEIPLDATVCHACQRPQSVFLNRIGPISTTLGILAVVLASVTYIGGTVRDALFAKASMQVVKITSKGQVIVNTGDYPILLEQVLIEVPDLDHQIHLSIDRVVSPKTDNQAQRVGQAGLVPVASHSSEFSFLRLTPEQVAKLREAEVLDFFPLVLSADSVEARTILKEYPSATHFSGIATVTAASWETGDTLSKDVDVLVFPCFREYTVPADTKYEVVNPPSFFQSAT